MNDNLLLQLGVGGIIALLVLKSVFDFLQTTKFVKNGRPSVEELLRQVVATNSALAEQMQVLVQETHDLWMWHSQTDEEGVKVWYVRKSLENAIMKLADNVDREIGLLERLDRRLERVEERMETRAKNRSRTDANASS